VLLFAGTLMLPGCGSNNSSIVPITLQGNWQFTMSSPTDQTFVGGLQGGFLLQNNGGAVTGNVAYSVALPSQGGSPTACNSGAAAVTGNLSGQNVSLTAVAGNQTFTLTGVLSFDGSTMAGTYSSTAGTASDGSACGTAQTGLQWNANLVPVLTGVTQGIFHSTGGSAGLSQQEFLVSGSFTQAENTGAATAAVTGNLSFSNSDYPCFTQATVEGQISGNSVVLQIVGTGGTNVGQIGTAQGSTIQAVTLNPTSNGYALQSLTGTGYAVYAAACGGGNLQSPADLGNLCLAVNNTKTCNQPVTLTPNALIFPSQKVGSSATGQSITLTNTSGSTLGVTLSVANIGNVSNFSEADTCGVNGTASQGQLVELYSGQFCSVTISFAPQVSGSLSANLNVGIPSSDAIVAVPLAGTGK